MTEDKRNPNPLARTSYWIICAILFFLHTHSASAQYYGDQYDRNMRLGLHFSPNIGWLNYENRDNGQAKVGYSYGLNADLGFARNYYFATGLSITSINSSANTPEFNRETYLKYAEVPLSIKLKSYVGNAGKVYGQFGFTGGVKISGREQLSHNENRTSIEGDDLFRLGLLIGTGMEWQLGENLGLLTGFSFNNGFTRAIREEGSPKTSYVSFNFGLLF